MALQRIPLRLVLLSDAKAAGRDLNQAGRGTDVENFVVAGRHLLVERLRDSQTCHELTCVAEGSSVISDAF